MHMGTTREGDYRESPKFSLNGMAMDINLLLRNIITQSFRNFIIYINKQLYEETLIDILLFEEEYDIKKFDGQKLVRGTHTHP